MHIIDNNDSRDVTGLGLLLIIGLLAFLMLPSPTRAGGLDASCISTNRPAATLLIPYFAVNLDDPAGKTTLFSINNAANDPTLARVVLWTDCGVPVLAFDVYLRELDVETINLRDVLVHGRLPVTTLDPAGQSAFPSCAETLVNPLSDRETRAVLQAQLTGQPSPRDGLCYASAREQKRIATGYVTVDALNDCSDAVRTPDDPGYFAPGGTGVASNRNVLWGDYFHVEPGEDSAQGFEAVAIVAAPERFADGTQTPSFYGAEQGADARVPLSSRFRSRFLGGGVFDGGTRFLIWTQRDKPMGPFGCATGDRKCPNADDIYLDVEFFDEQAKGAGSHMIDVPALVWELPLDDRGLYASKSFGVADLSVIEVDSANTYTRRQAWIAPVFSALGRFSVGVSSVRLDDLCVDSTKGTF